MSYILDALLKDKEQGQPKAVTPELHQRIVYAEAKEKSHSIAWGVLLTLAIFAALAAGFWLGQQGQPTDNEYKDRQLTSKEQQKLSPSTAESFNQDLVLKQSKVDPVNSQIAQIPAEQYFVNPPASNTQQQPLTADKTSQVVETAIIEPVVQDTALTFDASKLEGVSTDLLEKFQSAVVDTEQEKIVETPNEVIDYSEVPPLSDMPVAIQNSIPKLSFDMHIYASDGQGWVRVNGQDKYQGENISPELVLEAILPQKIVLDYHGERFTLPAMSSW